MYAADPVWLYAVPYLLPGLGGAIQVTPRNVRAVQPVQRIFLWYVFILIYMGKIQNQMIRCHRLYLYRPSQLLFSHRFNYALMLLGCFIMEVPNESATPYQFIVLIALTYSCETSLFGIHTVPSVLL